MTRLLEYVVRLPRWLAGIAVAGAVALLHSGAPALAQTDAAAGFPKQPIRMIVGLAPGGSNDIIARLVAQKLQERLGQPVIVENKPGAGGTIAADMVARATPLYHLVLSVSASLPIKTVKELVEWGKANPDKANYASTSAIFQLTTELFKQKTGTPFQHIPFKSGAELVTAVLSGQTTMTFADAGPAMTHFQSGKLRPLASTGATRLPELPDVPTLAQVGIDGVVVEGFIGLAAPKGTPQPIVKKLESEVMAILKLPDVAGRIKQIGLIPDGSTGAAFYERIAKDIPTYKAVAKAANIKFD
jgi:tripartite-type tricarboxylate transporter receptor subunit TctC